MYAGRVVFRLWYVACLGVDSDRQAAFSPVEIGCVNVIPKCNEWTGKHPVYENLPETYAAINNYLADSPLEGKSLDVNHQHASNSCGLCTVASLPRFLLFSITWVGLLF